MRIGITLPVTPDAVTGRSLDLRTAARHVEALGLDEVWVSDVVVGDGTPALEPVVALTTAAAVTSRVRLGFGVLALPQRPVALLAAQVASLQELSGGRVILGVGVGGFPGAPMSEAAGVRPGERGRRTDAALAVLPALLAGEPTGLGDGGGPPVVTLGPPVARPPIVVGGNSPAAIRRAVRYGDAWLPSLIGTEALAGALSELRRLAAEHGRTAPAVILGGHAVVGTGDAERRAYEELVRSLVEDHGLPAGEAAEVPMAARDPAELAARLSRYAELGIEGVNVAPEGGDWRRQAELIAEAAAQLT
jgi:alkanesulfonate monooxygenase SsuD/methylene tetrahydromethanopterin reductase-like flavin-dependent oxidoreductase (luciferase family)